MPICSFCGRWGYDRRLDHKSRMGREFHVRFCEGLGVQFPRATRLVIGFTDAEDARRVFEVLPQRFSKYGLTIHPDKTQLIPFTPPSASSREATDKGQGGGPRPGTFTLLGFTHYWGRSLKGNWVVKRKTASSRLSRAVRSIAQWCRRYRHQPLNVQQQTLSQKLRGHYAYYGITGNAPALAWFRLAVVRCWRYWLNRRNRERTLDWGQFNRLLKRYPLPPTKVVHSVYARAASP